MVQIASIDWEAKRFFLHPDTVTAGFDAWEAFAEIRVLQAANANDEQNYKLFLSREGRVPKGGGSFTARFIAVDPGWRAVPYDQMAHTLDLLVEMVSPTEGLSDRSLFDRSGVAVNVDIDPIYDQVEIIEVATGAGPTAEDIAAAVWAIDQSTVTDSDSMGYRFTDLEDLLLNRATVINNPDGSRTITFFEADGVTVKNRVTISADNTTRVRDI